MNIKIIIAVTIAGLSLATTAFAQGESTPGVAGGVYSRTIAGGLDNTTLPENGSEGAVQSPNSLPPGFYDGTPQARYAQSTNQWFAQQAAHRFAQSQQTDPHS